MTLILIAGPRIQRGKQSNQLRRQGYLPAIVYGHDEKPKLVTVGYGQFERVLHQAGKTTLVDLQIGDHQPAKVLIHDIQHHPVTDRIIHADLYKVKLTEKIKATIPIQVVGEAPAVKELQGSLITNKNDVEVEAFPQNLVSNIEVDVSSLETFDDVIHVKDLMTPDGIEILDDPEGVVVLVQPPRSEEELAKLEEKPVEDVESVSVEEKGKEEESTEGDSTQPAEEKAAA